MRALLSVLPMLFLIFLYCRNRELKGFLLFVGVFFIPFKIDVLVAGGGLGESNWTDGLYFSLSNAALLLLLVHLFFTDKRLRRVSGGDLAPILVFALACILSLTSSTWRMASLYQILTFLQVGFLYFFVLSKGLTSSKEVDLILVACMCSLIFQSSLAVLQHATGRELDFFSTGHREGDYVVTRAFGTNIGRPNGFAAIVSPLLLLSLSLRFGTNRHRVLANAACIAGFLGLVVSFSRGAWIGFIAGAVVLGAALYRDGLFKTVRPWKVIVLVGLLMASFFPYLRARVVDDYMNPAMASRIPLMGAAFEMIRAHPFFGVGVNTFRSIIGSYIHVPVFYLDEVHNQYLLVFSEAGAVGLIGWLWILIKTFRNSSLCLGEMRDTTIRYAALGVGAGFLACSVHMLFDLYNSQALLANLFVLASVLGAVNAFRRRAVLVVQGEE
jgi:hypothetical protein